MANKNFIVKNGLEVGGQEVVSSSGVVTSAALGGQTLASTDSPTFNNLTLTNDIAVGGDLNLTGDLNITGDVNSLSVTDLDVTDQTITLGAGQVESASGGSGIVVDGSGASILWDETNNEWDLNKSINVTGGITSSGITYMNRTGDGNFINFNSDGSEVGSIETQGNEIVLMSVDRGLRIRKSTSNSIIPVGTARTNLDDTMSLGSSGARFTTLYLSDNIFNWGKAGSVTVFNQDGTTADFRVESTSEQHMLFVDGGLNRIGMANSAPNAKLHIDSTAATGDATNPALQIGGTTTYRLGMYTSTEGGIIDNANGDDGLQFHTKNAGEAVRITADGNLQMIGQTTSFANPGFTYHTNNYLYCRGGSAGLILSDDSGSNTVQIIDGASGYINFETSNGTGRMRIMSHGGVAIGTNNTGYSGQILSVKSGTGDYVLYGESSDANCGISLRDNSSTQNIVYGAEGNNHVFKKDSAEYMRIDSSGNVKINNTRTTAVPLHVVGGTASGTMYDVAVFAGGQNSTSGSGAKIYLSGCENDPIARGTIIEGQMIDNGNSHALIFHTSGNSQTPAERMRIDSSGKVGIGASSPAGSGLHIKKDTSATTNELLRLSNSAGSTTDGVKIVMEVANTSGNGGEIGVVRDGGSFNPYMFFSTSSGVGSSPTEAMRIGSNNKIGVATTSTDHQLTVNASAFDGIQLQSGGSDCGYLGVNTDTVYVGAGSNLIFHTGNAGLTNGTERMRITAGGATRIVAGNSLELQNAAGNNEAVIRCDGAGTNTDLRFDTGGSERMRIDSSGKVGIGQDTPTGKLHVAGAKTYLSGTLQNMLQVEDTTSAASGVGGGIQFLGAYTGTTVTTGGSIEAWKSNGSGGNYAFDMVFKTRDNGGSNVERARFGADGGDPSYGRLRLTSSYGAFEIGAANASYFHFQRNTGPALFYFSNACQASGGFSTYSDERLKENIVTITGALDSVAKMNGVTFKWKDPETRGGNNTGKQFGVTAQNMLEVDSELPTLNADPLEEQNNIDDSSKDTDYYSMDYSRITPFLIEAIKELKTKLEAAEARIETLEG